MAVERRDDKGDRPRLQATNPVTGEFLGHVSVTPVADVPLLYERARQAQRAWGRLTVRERASRLQSLRKIIADHLDEIARRVAENTGKTEAEVLITEAYLVLGALEYVAKHAPRVLARRRRPTPLFLAGKQSWVEYWPKGVVLVIAPWNFPLQLALVPVVYALAAGNAVLLKPSEATPLVGVLIEELIDRAQLPEHLVQIAHGAGDLGAALVNHEPGPNHIFFTGSVATGKIIQAAATERLIPTTLELSGKDAMIVFADAPLTRAVNAAAWGAFMNCGQVCVAVERLYVERPIYDEFLARLAAETDRLRRLGRGAKAEDADVGAMTFAPQLEVVKGHAADALQKGARLVYGKPPEEWEGMAIPPVLLTGVREGMAVATEETFGPIATVVPFDTEDEAVALANASEFGLNASVWTRDRAKGERVASRLQSGGVAINDVFVTLANHHLPFGGVKQSGLGSNHGPGGLRAFSYEKSVMRDWLGRGRDVHWFPYGGKAPLFAQLLRSWFGPRRDWIGFFRAFVGLTRRSR